MEQKRLNRKREQLETAPRTNVYGDELRYVPGLCWQHILTDMTGRIISGQRREELKQLTEDAPRNRAAAVRKDDRSKSANDEYEKLFNEYKYRNKPNEKVMQADALKAMMDARQRGSSEAAAMVARQLMRQGGDKAAITNLYKNTAQTLADTYAEAAVRAKRQGTEDFLSRLKVDEGTIKSDLDFLREIANDTTTSPVDFSGLPGQLTQRGDAARKDVYDAMTDSQKFSAAAYQAAINQFGDGPKFSGSASFSSSGGGKGNESTERYRQYSGPQGSGWERTIDRPYTGNQGSFF
jgi:hypothetical protein